MPEQDLLKALNDYLEGDKIQQAVEIKAGDRLKVAICGDSGTGKTYNICRTCNLPIFVADFDGRRASVAGLKDVLIKTYTDKYDTDPQAWGAFEKDVAIFEMLKNRTPSELPFKSITLSSMTYLRKYAEHQFLKDSGVRSKGLTIGQINYLIPKDWDAITGVQHMLETLLERLFRLDIDVYAEFHLRNEKDKNKSTKENIVYKDNFTVEPENLKMLLPKFDEVWRTFVDNGEFKMQVRPDTYFGAKSALKPKEDIVVQDIQGMIKNYVP